MKKIKINGKEYEAKSFDFNLICDLEDMGVSLAEAKEKPMSMVRAYFAMCTGKGKDYAGKEMEQHLVNGGSFDDLVNAMSAEMENSDFFRSITKTAGAENRQGKSQTRKNTTA